MGRRIRSWFVSGEAPSYMSYKDFHTFFNV